jgi:hypothetical protein
MEIRVLNTREPIGGGNSSIPAKKVLSNNACSAIVTVQLGDNAPIEVKFQNEKEVRNLAFRFAPKALLTPELTEEFATDDLNELFKVIIATGKAMGLDLPEGIEFYT